MLFINLSLWVQETTIVLWINWYTLLVSAHNYDMKKPGPKPKGIVKIGWSSRFAYAIGLFTADGCVLNDGRHLDFTSKDYEQVSTFRKCLNVGVKIGIKHSGNGRPYFRIQFGDVLFRKFLINIGIIPAKSKTLTSVHIPDEYFADFLRGYFDGDGSSSSYYDPVFPNSYRFYIGFMSASPAFIHWLRATVSQKIAIKGHVSRHSGTDYLQLKYAKREAIILSKYMYNDTRAPLLKRKYLKIQRTMRIINARRGGEIGKHASFRS